ncbi:hypothetical protein N7495_003676 [Penicillium taxi]|uniref:uncharacterized protein n=1 Tax=Penicillium taxi TaxID=168475 RepID=UPI002544DFE3|nr:uncharacterized protein N7495_003676 [Penicillium taxi]KAJ5898932.1 hypothetical protein N7495_003676 [Penicillium taxi]
MADSAGDDIDSRTASVGIQRTRSNHLSANGSIDNQSNLPPRKRQRPNKRERARRNNFDLTSDFVPRGATFSGQLEVDPVETGLDVDNDADNTPQNANPNAGSTAPAINWNKASKKAVRTTLGKRSASSTSSAQPTPQSQSTSQARTSKDSKSKKFKAVNDAYWRVSNDSENEKDSAGTESDSDGAISLDSENDDSILLNIGTEPQAQKVVNNPEASVTIAMDQDTEDDIKIFSSLDSTESNMPKSTQNSPPQVPFSSKYSTPPTILRDLDDEDYSDQVKFMYWDRDPKNCYGDLPVGCKCTHCQAWGEHESLFCPLWRRCDRCRERGHNHEECKSSLQSIEGEVPCDICGCPWHVETRCDHYLMGFSQTLAKEDHFKIALQCARCYSFKHILGDCPYLTDKERYEAPLPSLRGVDPARIENLISNGDSRRDPRLPHYLSSGTYCPTGGRVVDPTNGKGGIVHGARGDSGFGGDGNSSGPSRKKKPSFHGRGGAKNVSQQILTPVPQGPASTRSTSTVPIVSKPRANGAGAGAWRGGKGETGAGGGRGRISGRGSSRGGRGARGGRGRGRGGRGGRGG